MVRLTADFWALDIRVELSWLGTYRTVLERHLTQLPDNPPDDLRADIESADEEIRQPVLQEWWILSEEAAPRLARGSYVVALYAAYQAGVIELADKVRTRVGAELALDDISGRTFDERARKYFDKVLRIPLCPDSGLWSTIIELSFVRHAFAHGNGRVVALKDNGKRIFAAMQQRGDAREAWGTILIEAQYTQRAYEAVNTMMRDLIKRTKTPRLPAGSSSTADE
jgi:hypothetical protein